MISAGLHVHSATSAAASSPRFEGRTMLAAIFRRAGQPLTIERVEVAEPSAGEALVKMAASGACRSDYHVLAGEWGAPTPLILGHEGAGIVESVGEGVDGGQLTGFWYRPEDEPPAPPYEPLTPV
jgi:D-arabinose 1-dehydrogenase-like Zn-dependent alcohol dehydrogenase